MLGQMPLWLTLPLVHSAADADCCAFSSPLSKTVAVVTCPGHCRLDRQPWLGFPLGQGLLCPQGLMPVPGSGLLGPRESMCIHTPMRGYGPVHGPPMGRGTPSSLHSLLPSSCHGDHQTFSINAWREKGGLPERRRW